VEGSVMPKGVEHYLWLEFISAAIVTVDSRA
jgi:hypothetical protein